MKKFRKVWLFLILAALALPAASCKKSALDEDLDAVTEYISQAWAAYDDAAKQGFDLKKARFRMKVAYRRCRLDHLFLHRKDREVLDGVERSSMRYAILYGLHAAGFSVNDGHFSVWDGELSDSYALHTPAFFADVLFEQRDGEFFVVSGSSDGISAGMKFTGNAENLAKISVNGADLYRFVYLMPLRWKPAKKDLKILKTRTLGIPLDGKTVFVPCYDNEGIIRERSHFGFLETAGFLYVSVSDFSLGIADSRQHEDAEKRFDELNEKIAASLSGKKSLILDLRGNTGGSLGYGRTLMESLLFGNDVEKIQKFDAMAGQAKNGRLELESLLTVEADYKRIMTNGGFSDEAREWITKKLEEKRQNPRRLYTGLDSVVWDTIPQLLLSDQEQTLYILIDWQTASAAEETIALAYIENHDKIVLVGENSCGCSDFGGVYSYELPHSKVLLNLCMSDDRNATLLRQNEHWHGDFNGFYPDYWAPSEQLLDTLVSLTGDTALKTTLAGLSDKLL